MKYIRELEGLRGVMALWVVVGHSLLALPGAHSRLFQSLGKLFAVDVFIILSGYVIFSLLSQTRDNYLAYLVKRIFRIFPLYLLVLLISVSTLGYFREIFLQAAPSETTMSSLQLIDAGYYKMAFQLLTHVILLQGIIPPHWIPLSSYTFAAQAWSVSVEWQFYLIAPLLFAWLASSEKTSSNIKLAILIIAVGGWATITDDGFVGRHGAMFILGFVSLYFYRDLAGNLSTRQILYIAFLLMLGTALILPRYAVPVIIWCVTFGSVIVYRRHPERTNPVARLLNLGLTTFVGRVSYSIYMIHMFVVMALLKVFTCLTMPMPVLYVVFPLMVTAFTLLFSSATYKYIELPSQRFGKKLASHLGNKTASLPARPLTE